MWRLLFFLVAVISESKAADDDLIVQTPNGKVQGTTIKTESGAEFYAWRHIPFAKPPLGELRFQPPVDPEPWTDILDGTKDSYACLNVGSYEGDPVPTYGFSEDCLYVNVYSPFPANLSLNLPVMFWIYGGGFFIGTGDFSFTDPTPFLEENVIVVTFNYRLDIFGFLSTEDTVVAGNTGLKDQLSALLWTNENIQYFGGDNTSITIFGESAGAMSVGYHLTSPLSKGKFSGAIMESGTCLLNYLTSNPRKNAIIIAKLLNDSITDDSSSEEILQVLQLADAELLVNISLASRIALGINFNPTMEVELNNPIHLISKPLYEELEAGNASAVPIIIGTNSEEQLWVSSLEDAKSQGAYYDSNLNLLLPNMPLKETDSIENITQAIKEAYVGNSSFYEDPGALIRFLSDNTFVRPAIKHASLQSQFSDVYFYEFSFVGSRSVHPDIPGCGHVAHAEEVPYLFNISAKSIATEADFLTRRRMVKLWTNFAKFKNPTPDDESMELLQNVTWEKFDSTNLQYLDIGENLRMRYNREVETTVFWDYLWSTYSYHPYNTF